MGALTCSFLIGLGTSNVLNRNSAMKKNSCIITGMTPKTPALHAVSTKIHHKSVLTRARKLAAVK
jgi:hypothetical protein